jgi:tRNA pseudouridine55 synthase
LNGFLLIDKPSGPTSFFVVTKVRKICRVSRVGHSGTLDPAASGLLLIALGNATRLLPYVPLSPKYYAFCMKFGSQTDTLDSEGTVVLNNGRIPVRGEIEKVLAGFIGESMQLPPKYSAVKIQGKHAYDLARANEPFELKEKPVHIYSLMLDSYDEAKGEAQCHMSCSQGTYVRAVIRDVAALLQTYAHATAIRRTGIGSLSVEMAVVFDLLDSESINKHLLLPKVLLAEHASIIVDKEQCLKMIHGIDLDLPKDFSDKDTVVAYTETGTIVAVLLKKEDGLFHPNKVFVKESEL